jgi:hypothetical protein
MPPLTSALRWGGTLLHLLDRYRAPWPWALVGPSALQASIVARGSGGCLQMGRRQKHCRGGWQNFTELDLERQKAGVHTCRAASHRCPVALAPVAEHPLFCDKRCRFGDMRHAVHWNAQ